MQSSSDHLVLYEGMGVMGYPFSGDETHYASPRKFLGSIRYVVGAEGEEETGGGDGSETACVPPPTTAFAAVVAVP